MKSSFTKLMDLNQLSKFKWKGFQLIQHCILNNFKNTKGEENKRQGKQLTALKCHNKIMTSPILH